MNKTIAANKIELNDEVLMEIFCNMNIGDLSNLKLVCKAWSEMLEGNMRVLTDMLGRFSVKHHRVDAFKQVMKKQLGRYIADKAEVASFKRQTDFVNFLIKKALQDAANDVQAAVERRRMINSQYEPLDEHHRPSECNQS